MSGETKMLFHTCEYTWTESDLVDSPDTLAHALDFVLHESFGAELSEPIQTGHYRVKVELIRRDIEDEEEGDDDDE